jgi:cellulose biosynthesis protein BcsQ
MRPFTLAVVASKGGVGKSVLATCLAAHAAKAGHTVGLVDMDAQGSTTLWHRMRDSPDNPALLGAGKAPKVDVTIIDGPPSNMAVIERAIRACDVAVIVTTLLVGTVAGAVYNPPAVMAPVPVPLTDQFTSVLLRFRTVAVH